MVLNVVFTALTLHGFLSIIKIFWSNIRVLTLCNICTEYYLYLHCAQTFAGLPEVHVRDWYVLLILIYLLLCFNDFISANDDDQHWRI